MEIRGLLFDMSGVLYDDSAWNRWLLQLLRRMGLHTNYDAFRVLCDHELGSAEGGDYWAELKRFLSSVGLSQAQIDEVEAAGFARWQSLQLQIRPFPGVIRTLTLLSHLGMPKGIVAHSQGGGTRLRNQLREMGLDGQFQTVESFRTNGDIQSAFQTAWEQMGLNPGYGGYVANHTSALRQAQPHCGRLIAFNTKDRDPAHHRLQRFQELIDFARSSDRMVG